MRNIKKILVICLIFSLLIINLITVSYAEPVKVTKENLTESLEKFVKSGEDGSDYVINVLDDVIEISVEGEMYQVKYDLTDKPTFWVEGSVTQGMTYDEFEKQTEGMILLMIPYVAVADVQGVELQDATKYMVYNMLGTILSGVPSSNSEYIIYDDRNSTENLINTDNKKVIKASEFGDHAMEYVNASYKNPATITDSQELNSFTWTTEQKDVTATSCKLVSTLTVDTDADFSKTKEAVEKMENSIDSSMSNSIGSIQNSINNNTTVNETNTTNITKLPQTGEEITAKDILYGVIAFAVVGVFALYIYSKRINQDK